ncbi:hypothetical protein F4604DRAFT_1930851 [Suillus subluteus]|nr:hypothetical protein F4604DRAFT_1930851 [Suillus subluteus]
MPRSQGSGRGRGRSASTVQVANPNIPRPGESIHPFQPILFQPNPNTIERLASAAAMIEMAIPSIRYKNINLDDNLHSFHPKDVCASSIYDLDGDKCPECARRSAKSEVKPTDMRYYEEPDQKNIKHACKLIVLDMLLESRWQKTSELEQVAAECISQASAVSGHVTEPTEGINKLIFDGLSTIRGKLVNEAERVLSALDIYPPNDTTMSDDEKNDYIQQRVNDLLDDKHISGYALHGYDPDRGKTLVYSAPAYLDLHEDFWFGCTSPFLDPQSRVLITRILWIMYALTGAAIMCVIRWIAGGIRQSMMEYVAKPELDEYKFMPCMQAHHDKCLQKLRTRTGELSPKKNTMSYVASTTAELYQRPPMNQPAPMSSSSSSSLPSSTFDYHPALVTSSSSSSSSSTTSWLPCQDEHDPVVTNSPTMAPFNQYYSVAHYSSSGQHGLADPNSSPALPYNVPSDLHGFNTGSDQYSIGGSSWGGGASESTLGPVRVPTVDGWYNSQQTFRPVYLSGCDVELGRDWLASVNAKFDGSQLQRPSEMDVGRLSGGHSWNFQLEENRPSHSCVVTDHSVTQVGSCLATQAGSSIVTRAGLSSSSSSCSSVLSRSKHVVDNFFGGYESLSRSALSDLAVAHGLRVPSNSSMEDLRQAISQHIGTGFCGSHSSRTFEGCKSVRQELDMSCGDEEAMLSARISFLTAILTTTKRRPLEQLLKANGVSFEVGSKTGQLRRTLRKHIKLL